MYPAPSIVLFTVLSGLGLGLMVWLGLDLGPDDGGFRWLACALALALAGAGGLASTGHLGRRDRAWRAFSQWRSSWLSREACLMVAAMAAFGLYAAVWCLGGVRLWGLGLIASALSAATIYATAMIYAQLKTVPRWSVTPTPALFVVSGLTGGLLVYGAVAGAVGVPTQGFLAIVALVVTIAVVIWWQTSAAGAVRSVEGSTLETATGLGFIGRVRSFEAPHTGANYLLKEMGYQIGRKRAFELRRIGAVLGLLAPLVFSVVALLIGGGLIGGGLVVLALIAHVAGMLALRWLFFAEAEHVQALYYGRK
jgi:DMSO reductase anchor subunit